MGLSVMGEAIIRQVVYLGDYNVTIRNGAYHRLRTVLKPEHDIWIVSLRYRQQHIGKPSGWTIGREADFLVTLEM